MRKRASLFVTSLLLASVAACGDSTPNVDADADPSEAAADAGVEAGPVAYPAFVVDAPQVLDAKHGTVLATPRVVPVYFQSDDTAVTTQITTALNAIAASTYWGPQVAEYGVGKLSIAAPITLAQVPAATLSSADIRAWLANEIASDASLPKPDASTIYALFYPAGTAIADGGGQSCTDFFAFHSATTNGNDFVPYIVSPRCPSFTLGFYGQTVHGVDAVTAPVSHELIEAATDPFPNTSAAWHSPDAEHAFVPTLVGGSELTDYCNPFEASFYAPSDVGHYVARSWSNKAAAAGHDPCVPADPIPYFNTMPVMPDDVTIVSSFGTMKAKGLSLTVGASKTVELDLFSDAPTSSAWTITAEPFSPGLTCTLDHAKGQNGDKLSLTVKETAKGPGGWNAILITSRLGTRSNYWLAYVATP